MTDPQAPTPGPLSADDVKLLVKGDLLLLDGQPVRFINLFMGGIRADDGSDKRISALPVERFAFIGRPDADGWMPWSGGENPVPGQRVEVRLRDGSSASPDEGNWVHDPRPGTLDDIIAFRLVPTAPVEASGSELWPVGSWLSAALDDPKVCDDMKADIRQWFDAGGHFRPQPTREADEATQAALERLTAMAARPDVPGFPYADAKLADLRLVLALIRPAPVASGGQHSSGEGERADKLASALTDLMPAVRAYLMTGDVMSQSIKKNTWEPVLKRAQAALNGADKPDTAASSGLIETIRTRLLGIAPDDQDVTLEDSDWLLILGALEGGK